MMQNINAQLAAGKVSLCDPLARIRLRNTQSYKNGNTYDAKNKCAARGRESVAVRPARAHKIA